MNLKYKENNFSIDSVSTPHTSAQYNTYKTAKPNIDRLIKRLIDEKKRGKKRSFIILGIIFFLIILMFYFF
tara:strand:+ start:223 stop:435 length:213 start_codon:yes stop_codon:yes gene_type:complete